MFLIHVPVLGFSHNVPDLSIKGLLSSVHAVVDTKQFILIKGNQPPPSYLKGLFSYFKINILGKNPFNFLGTFPFFCS